MFDARQLLDETAAGGDDQRIVRNFAGVGQYGAATVAQAGHPARDELDLVFIQKASERLNQVAAFAQAGRNPDQAGQEDEFGLRRDQGQAGLGQTPAQFAGCGQRGEAGAEDEDAGRGVHGNSDRVVD